MWFRPTSARDVGSAPRTHVGTRHSSGSSWSSSLMHVTRALFLEDPGVGAVTDGERRRPRGAPPSAAAKQRLGLRHVVRGVRSADFPDLPALSLRPASASRQAGALFHPHVSLESRRLRGRAHAPLRRCPPELIARLCLAPSLFFGLFPVCPLSIICLSESSRPCSSTGLEGAPSVR